MRMIFTFLLLFSTITLQAQKFTKTIAPYSKLKVARGIEVTLVKSESKQAHFDIQGLLKSDIIIEQDEGALSLKVRTRGLWELMEANSWWVKVTLPFDSLTEIGVTTGARVKSSDEIAGPSINLVNKMGAELDLQLNTAKLDLVTSMGSVNLLAGKARELIIDADMGAEVEAFQMQTRYATVESGKGATVEVSCEFEFDGFARMGGEITVKGNPQNVFQRESMGGYIGINQ